MTFALPFRLSVIRTRNLDELQGKAVLTGRAGKYLHGHSP